MAIKDVYIVKQIRSTNRTRLNGTKDYKQ